MLWSTEDIQNSQLQQRAGGAVLAAGEPQSVICVHLSLSAPASHAIVFLFSTGVQQIAGMGTRREQTPGMRS